MLATLTLMVNCFGLFIILIINSCIISDKKVVMMGRFYGFELECWGKQRWSKLTSTIHLDPELFLWFHVEMLKKVVELDSSSFYDFKLKCWGKLKIFEVRSRIGFMILSWNIVVNYRFWSWPVNSWPRPQNYFMVLCWNVEEKERCSIANTMVDLDFELILWF